MCLEVAYIPSYSKLFTNYPKVTIWDSHKILGLPLIHLQNNHPSFQAFGNVIFFQYKQESSHQKDNDLQFHCNRKEQYPVSRYFLRKECSFFPFVVLKWGVRQIGFDCCEGVKTHIKNLILYKIEIYGYVSSLNISYVTLKLKQGNVGSSDIKYEYIFELFLWKY